MADYFLVEFNGHRREYYSNAFHHRLKRGDSVITDADPGEDFGWILHHWDFEKNPPQKGAAKAILRSATSEEADTYKKIRPRQLTAKSQARVIAKRLGLKMKLTDVDIQFDGKRIVFYYTADGRVDFRALVKELASTFRTWIEMRQISPREETRRIGDCGLCGGEVCCRKAGMKNIQVGTQDARDQDLQLNLSKLTGLCGKLRCCLNFERGSYLTAKKLFPGRGTKVDTPVGRGVLERVDVFREEAIVRMADGSTIRVGPDQVNRAGAVKAPQVESKEEPTRDESAVEESAVESSTVEDTP
ncbi:MAG: Signal peptidase-like protein [candidate division Zixibacteria bacterium]|nr:Signal peptidase-like protein [candidate division Zixibacteria bacterium]